MREGEPTSNYNQFTDEETKKSTNQEELNGTIQEELSGTIVEAYAANQQKLSGLGSEMLGTDYLATGLETDNTQQ